MASVAVLMSVLWIFESMPLAITALLPLILLPIYGRYGTESDIVLLMRMSQEFHLRMRYQQSI